MIFHQFSKYLFFILLFVLVIPNSKAGSIDQEAKVVFRAIGDEFLLQIGDSTSRVLPIEKINGRYAVKFEREFSFEPDLLFFAVYKVIDENEIQDKYIVEVEKCGSNEVIHSFEASLERGGDLTPCSGRVLPEDCYTFYFNVIQDMKPVLEPESKSAFNYIYVILIILVGSGLFVYLKKRKQQIKLDSNLIDIGQFQFDQKGMLLKMKAQSIELSSKESDLLFLLFSNENKTLTREEILNVVWGDEGDYVGRTLDVFISKLRKKLEADPSLKIVNIRGVGYRFVMG